MSIHPLDPLSDTEIRLVASIIRECEASDPFFRVITLQEPPKAELVPYLEQQHSETSAGQPARVARVQASIIDDLYEFKVDISARNVIARSHLQGRHSYLDAEYMKRVESICLADDRVQDEITRLRLPDGATVVVEAWAYAPDGLHDPSDRLTMCYFYMRLSEHLDANYYAYPLSICAEVSSSLAVTKVFHVPTGDASGQSAPFDARKIHSTSEYHPDLQHERRSITSYHVRQPQGPSFVIEGRKISWQKWTMRVGFNYREGMTLHDIRYDGRSVFYRLSLSEMFVPYGDGRFPFPRKAAFDVGNDGAGVNANDLQLGCDCLGHIAYFDAWHILSTGTPVKMPHVICCHEIDDGVLWKHTNFRTQNAVVARSRLLVLQTIITVNNYEYIFCFYFGQDASIHYEVRATGILSTVPIDIGQTASCGTVVAPGVLAPFHQHLFCLRIDAAIDGPCNSLVVEESHPLPFDNTNPFGVGYTTKSKIITGESGLDLDFATNRVFKMVNENRRNPITGSPVGYKLLPCYSQLLLAHPDSLHAKRSEFAAHALWLTRYDDDELFPAGKHTMQSKGGEGIASWIANRPSPLSTQNEDIVLWHTFGSTHNPRIEDWPVMPCEKMIVGLKPVNFFDRNPSTDVPAATQEQSQSVLVNGA